MSGKLVEITPARMDEAVGVLSRAFLASPLVRFLAGEDVTADDPRMREWWRFSCAVRTDLGWPLLGVEHEGIGGRLGVYVEVPREVAGRIHDAVQRAVQGHDVGPLGEGDAM